MRAIAQGDTIMSEARTPPIGVLLVDDHPVVRAGLRLVVEADPRLRVVGELGSGREAARWIADLEPDVVLMDINLPDISGLEATRAVKERNPAVKVLIVSSHSDDEYVIGALDAGADGYLLKQCPPEELRAGIVRVCHGERVIHPVVVPALIARATRRDDPRPDALSRREREVLQQLAAGATSKEIAADLGLSPKTVENHRARVLDKLGVANSAAAVQAAISRGLLGTLMPEGAG